MRISSILKSLAACAVAACAVAASAQSTDTVLKPDDVKKLLPEKVYYKGQSAPTQLRNSGGVKLADGGYILATLVDNSGYSTGIAAKYQGYFIVEVPVKIAGQALAAGVYGIGFIDGDKFAITDVGASDVLSVSSQTDAALKRPMPLQVVADPAGGFRLYAGRRFVVITR